MKFKPTFTTIINAIKKRWILYLGIAILIAVSLFFYIRSINANKVELIFENPVTQSIVKTLDVSGHVDAKEKVRLRFLAGGKLTYIGALEGETVKKWQTIAAVDKAALKKQIDQNLNNYMKERWDWEDTRDSNEGEVLTTSEQRVVDKEQWDLTNTVLTVEIQDIALQNTALYAPFEGILTTAPTSVAGMQVLASDYFEIVNPETLIFRAAVDESDISNIKVGQQATLILDAYEDTDITTHVSYISYTSAETSSGTAFVVEFKLSQADLDQMLRIGMNGDIQVLLEEKDTVLTIPSISLIQRDETNYVMVKSGENKSEEREVEIGLETDDFIEILSGLSESDEIVIPE
jgi:macrolide-specific efflux system membrane fusion protein